MESLNNFISALEHKSPDKIPVDFGSTAVSGMHVSCVASLRDYYGLEKRPVKIVDPYQMLGLIDDDLQNAVQIDVTGVFPRNTMFGFPNEEWKPFVMDSGLEVLVSGHFNTTKDSAGNTLIYPKGDLAAPPRGMMPKGGYFFDAIIYQEEIDDDNLRAEDNLEEFTVISDSDIEYFKSELTEAGKTGKGVVVSMGGTALGDIALVPAPFLAKPKGIRSIEEWYISTVTRKDLLKEIFERQTDIALINLQKLNAACGNLINVINICGTDFGTQTTTFCSRETFCELYMPFYKKVNNWIHSNTKWKTFKHSCGAIGSMLDLIIESGFDIINPVQCSCEGMEPEKIKEQFGKNLVFWGGGVDTQKTLPFGSAQDVRGEVLKRCEIFSRDGGFVFSGIHNIQANTPIGNIVAMIDAVKEFNGN